MSTDTPETARRPFYTEFAWAFDLLIDRPVRKECATIVTWLTERGILPGAQLLDAGCGTGRYAIELARRGYAVEGVDLSKELIAVAADSAKALSTSVSFSVGDLAGLSPAHCDAILCRGVLNDFLDDETRRAAFERFRQALRPEGLLILDVREWEATAQRKVREPLFRKRVSTDRGTLTFTSITTIDRDTRRLIISESHALDGSGRERSSDYVFVMRCWTKAEVDAALHLNGFGGVAYFGAYDSTVAAGATDRLVAVAQRRS